MLVSALGKVVARQAQVWERSNVEKKQGGEKRQETRRVECCPGRLRKGGKVSHGNEKEWEGMDTTEQVMLVGMCAVKVS